MLNPPNAVLDEGRELEIERLLRAPRLQNVRPIYERGFEDGVPASVRLWELEPAIPDGLEPAERKASIYRDIAWLSQGDRGLDKEQVEALERAFDAPGGLNLVDGKSMSGKTSLAVTQALIAAWSGYKVLICSPSENDSAIGRACERALRALPKNRLRKIYWAAYGPQWTATGAKQELLDIQESVHQNLTMLTGQGMLKLIKSDMNALRAPECQKQLKDKTRDCTELLPLMESNTLWRMWRKMDDNASLLEVGRFNALYKKVYSRVLADADILITSCDQAGFEEFTSNFKPTVVIVDNCHLASVSETWLPLLAYSSTRMRTIIGDTSSPPSPNGDQPRSETDAHQGSLLQVSASRQVPVHVLKAQYSSPEEHGYPQRAGVAGQGDWLKLTAMEDVQKDDDGFIGRRKPCLCGSQKRLKNCCGKLGSEVGESSSKIVEQAKGVHLE